MKKPLYMGLAVFLIVVAIGAGLFWAKRQGHAAPTAPAGVISVLALSR